MLNHILSTILLYIYTYVYILKTISYKLNTKKYIEKCYIYIYIYIGYIPYHTISIYIYTYIHTHIYIYICYSSSICIIYHTVYGKYKKLYTNLEQSILHNIFKKI